MARPTKDGTGGRHGSAPPGRAGSEARKSAGAEAGIGGIFKGLGSFIEFVSDLAERQSQTIERHGEFGDEKGVRAVYGFTMRLGGGQARVEPFGNVRKGKTGQAVVSATREPLVDLIEEEGSIRVLAEMPGVEEGDIRCDLTDKRVSVSAAHGDRRYEKEIELPAAVTREGMRQSFRNGILELVLRLAEPESHG